MYKKLCKSLIGMNKARKFWTNLLRKYEISGKDMVIAMTFHQQEYSYYMLRYLYALKEQKNINRVFVLTSQSEQDDYIKKEASVKVNIVHCEEEDIFYLSRLYAIYRFTDQIIFDTYKNVSDTDGEKLIGVGEITIKDVVAVSMMGLYSVPDIENIKQEQEEEAYKFLDWSKWKNHIGYTRLYDNETDMVDVKIQKLIKQNKIQKKDKIVLFGVNKASMYIMDMLQDYNIVAIIDNDTRKIHQEVNGVSVYSPEEFLFPYKKDVKIIIASQYYKKMCEQLYQFGYEIHRQIYVVYYMKYLYNTHTSTMFYYKNEIMKGFGIYQNIRAEYPNHHILLCPYPGTGDIYLVGLYMEAFLKKQGIKDYILVVPSKGCCKVADLFNVKTTCISKKEAYSLLTFSRIIGLDAANVTVFNDSYGQGMVLRLRGYGNNDFHSMFQKSVFDVEEKITSVDIFQKNSDELFEKYHLKQGKTILFSPYANTILNLPDSFWESLVAKLKARGYTVCTNSCSDEEKPIAGTLGLFIPYNMAVDFLNKAGGFIGLRSGLCDIVSSSCAKMVVLYPEGNIFGACSTYDYFSLEKMELKKSNLLELIFSANQSEDMTDDIIDFIEANDES